MMYFNDCRTAEELKKVYKEWAKRLHPDNGGTTEEFQRMQAEFSQSWERLKNIHVTADGEEYTKETDETAEAFMQLLAVLMNLSGVETEICGSWIWCSGNTQPFKELFKRLGFRWSRSKEAWYFHREPYRKRHGRELSLDEIRDMYGSYKPEKQGREEQKKLRPA